MLRTLSNYLAFLLVALILTEYANADALVVTRAMKASTIAEIFITDDEVRVEIEVGAADLAAFRDVLPDDTDMQLLSEERM